MASLSVEVSVSNLNGGAAAVVSMAVDSTADHSMLPASMLGELGIVPKRRLVFTLPDGISREYDYRFASFGINGNEAPCPILFGPDGVFTLGASALAAFNLEENPGGDGLAPARWLSLGDAFRGGDSTCADKSLYERLRELDDAGLIKMGTMRLPDYFWDLPRPADPEGTVLAALLQEREEGR